MEQSAFNAFKSFLAQIWRLFTGWHLPFTNATPAMILFLGLIIPLIVRIVRSLLSVSPFIVGVSSGSARSDLIRRSRRGD